VVDGVRAVLTFLGRFHYAGRDVVTGGLQAGNGSRAGDTAPASLARPRADAALGPCLFLVAQCNRPLAAPARLRLGDLDEIELRRGDGVAIAPRARAPRHLDLVLPDARISSRHARLASVSHRWHIEDRGSRNGTFVNGARVERATLADGDWIDIGQAVFRYRENMPQDGALVSSPSPAVPRGMASLVPAIQHGLDELAQMAASPIAILIEGESGTGKEVVARSVHAISARAGTFVGVNCGGLPRERVAAELFGWKRGAFPGAVAEHVGLVRAADRGTLFLDEIGDLPLADQATILRVLQEHEVLPIGGTRPVPVDLRVIAATHRPLDALAARDEFRGDLLARLGGYRATLTPLRDRREDIGLLLAEILRQRHADEAEVVTIQVAALRALVAHPWPANIRALEQTIAQAMVRRAGNAIEVQHLGTPRPATPVSGPPSPHDHDPRRAELMALLRTHDGNLAAVARAMGKARMQIQRWLKRYQIDPRSFRR
jgi:DNA-binding NtrC family response regulator